jgi:hypothetical protein
MLHRRLLFPRRHTYNRKKALKNIENIVAGDVVGGYDHTLKKFAWGVVKATKKSIKRGLVSLFAAGT